MITDDDDDEHSLHMYSPAWCVFKHFFVTSTSTVDRHNSLSINSEWQERPAMLVVHSLLSGSGHDQADSESKWIELKSEFWLKLTLCDTSTGYIIIIIFIMGGYGT